MSEFQNELHRLFAAGIGVIRVTADKAKEIIDYLVEQGDITLEQGRELKDEMVKKAKEHFDEDITIHFTRSETGENGVELEETREMPVSEAVEDLARRAGKLTLAELELLRRRLFPE